MNIQHLKNLCIIHADFNIWSGQTRLSASDLKLGEGGEIPPERLAQLGSKRICDPIKLRGFHRLKTEARRLLGRYGMPFLNGFAVPISKADEICEKLNSINTEFSAIKAQFISDYHSAVEDWIRENPKYENAIRSGALPVEEVEKRIGFDYQVFAIEPTNDEANAKRLKQKVEGLGDDLMSEIVRDARAFYNERLAGYEQCNVSTRQTLQKIRDKVDSLSFLNRAFDPLVKLLDHTLLIYEQHAEGRSIGSPYFYQIVAAALIMSERSRIEDYSHGILNVDNLAKDYRSERADQMANTEKSSLETDDIDDFFERFEDSAAEAEANGALITTIEDDLYF